MSNEVAPIPAHRRWWLEEKAARESAEAELERLRKEIAESLIKRVELIDAASAREQGAYRTAEEHLNRAEAAEARIEALEGCLRDMANALMRYSAGGIAEIADLLDRYRALLPPAPDPRSGPDGPVADHVEGYRVLPGEEPDRDLPQE